MIPYNYVAPVTTFVGAGQAGISLPVHQRGFVNKLRVVQLSGTKSRFSYTLYDTIAACQPITGLPLAGLGTT
jgi:hypothetical protein